MAAMHGMQVKRLRQEATMPLRGSEHAAGFDVSAAEAATVPAGGKAIVKTGLSIAIPEGTYARLAPRSGLAAKRMINVGAGVVDYDYRGEVGVVLFNHGPEDFPVAVGDRIAQLILEKVCMVGCVMVDTLDETARGSGGFGSTGVAQGYSCPESGASTSQVRRSPEVMQVKKLNPSAAMPVRGSDFAAGFDLSSAEAVTVPARGKAIVKTGLAIAIPANTYARVAPRSGLAAKKMIQVGAGVVDYDYRGEVGVVLFNHGPEDFPVAVGDRIAQLILEEISMVSCVEVESLDETMRGEGGFGSTGVAEKVDVSATLAPSKRAREELQTPDKGVHAASNNGQEEVAALHEKIESLQKKLSAALDMQKDMQEMQKAVAALQANSHY